MSSLVTVGVIAVTVKIVALVVVRSIIIVVVIVTALAKFATKKKVILLVVTVVRFLVLQVIRISDSDVRHSNSSTVIFVSDTIVMTVNNSFMSNNVRSKRNEWTEFAGDIHRFAYVCGSSRILQKVIRVIMNIT